VKQLLSLILFLFVLTTDAQQGFITTWEVSSDDIDLAIIIPTNTDDYSYDYSVDFGDGTILTNQTGDITHYYTAPGTYIVSITGVFPHFHGIELDVINTYANQKIRSVDQWGDIVWQDMTKAFYDCYNLDVLATDAPNLSQTTSLSYMFSSASVTNGNLDNWDVSNITDMSYMFRSNTYFNQPLNSWDTSNVTNMSHMFYNATTFNQPIGNWDVSSVVDMSNMFSLADNFNQNINLWDVSNVTNMHRMFKGAESFNQSLNNWDVSSVTDMSWMFSEAFVFNQSIGGWNTSSVQDMSHMFRKAYAFNQNLNNWDVSNVITMNHLFSEANSYNQPLDNWDVSNVQDLSNVFLAAESFNQNINNWDVTAALTMQSMFAGTDDFNQPLDNWDVSNVTDMNFLFSNTDAFNQPINNWNVSNVTTMIAMFSQANAFNQPLDFWDVSNVTNMDTIFQSASSFNQDLSNWDFNIDNFFNIVQGSGLDTTNYDLLLDRLVQLDIQNEQIFAPNLYYCDEFTRQKLLENGWSIGDAGLSPGCNLNYLSGKVIFDSDNNGCTLNDANIPLNVLNISNGQVDLSVPTDENGDFLMRVIDGTYTLSLVNVSSYFFVNPSSQTINFNASVDTVDDVFFCVSDLQDVFDLSIDIIPLEDAIPGFATDYQLFITNLGTSTVTNIQATFSFDNNVQSFVSSSVTPNSSTSDMLTFQFTSLDPFHQEIIDITLLNAVPPILNSGDVVYINAQVSPDDNDINIKDNIISYEQTVVNSYDPNDKLAIQGDEIFIEDIDQYLDYRIRFQNLGTANALNIKITDTIDNNLDWTTFQPMSSSHDYRIELIDGEEINYFFDNINLPFESADPEGSNGYITYKIKPKSTVQIGDTFENTAYIYFDFNLPIITNTVVTTVVDELSTTGFLVDPIKLYPNPVQDKLHIDLPPGLQLNSIELFDIQGKRIKAFSTQNELDFSQIQKGIYLLKIETDNGSYNQKIIKK